MKDEEVGDSKVKLHLAQLVVERGLSANFGKIQRVLAGVQPGEWVVFPEASLSGYFPEDPKYTQSLNASELERNGLP